jgi:hypothetical protein
MIRMYKFVILAFVFGVSLWKKQIGLWVLAKRWWRQYFRVSEGKCWGVYFRMVESAFWRECIRHKRTDYGCTKCNKESNDLHLAPSIVRVVESRILRRTERVTYTGDIRNAHKIIIKYYEGKISFEWSGHRWRCDINLGLTWCVRTRSV